MSGIVLLKITQYSYLSHIDWFMGTELGSTYIGIMTFDDQLFHIS